MRLHSFTLLLLLAAFGTAPALPAQVIWTVKAAGGNYTPTELQSALDDARVYQDETGCEPLVIEIDAGLVITGNFILDSKACEEFITVRSSRTGELPANTRVLPSHAPLLATLTAPVATDRPVLQTKIQSATRYWRFQALKFTVEPPTGTPRIVWIGYGECNDPPHCTLAEKVEPLMVRHIEFDKVWITGNESDSLPNTGLFLYGNNLTVQNSRIERIQSPTNDTQAILLSGGNNNRILNNYLDAAGENFFTIGSITGSARNVDFFGNHLFKSRRYRWRFAVGQTPSGACVDQEYFLDAAEDYSQNGYGARIVTALANNAGRIQLTVPGHNYSNGDKVLVTGVAGLPGANAGWVAEVIDPHTFLLAGSVWRTVFTPSNGRTTKVASGYVCSAGVWTPTSLIRQNSVVKNLWESKGSVGYRAYGNLMDGSWPQYGGQSGSATLLNLTDPPHTIENVEFWANKVLHSSSGFIMGYTGGHFPRGISGIKVFDNLYPSMGQLDGGPNFAGSNSHPFVVFTLLPTDIHLFHNTMVRREPGAGAVLVSGDGSFRGSFRLDHNVISHGVFGFTGAERPNGWCNLMAQLSNSANFYIEKLVLPQLATNGESGYATSGTVTCPGPPWHLYPDSAVTLPSSLSGTFVNDSPAGTGDYRIQNALSFAKNAALDREGDVGADIALVDWATEQAASGENNSFFHLILNPVAFKNNEAELYYVAPTTETCRVSVSAQINGTSPVYDQDDAGGNPSRHLTIGGLSPRTRYFARLTCGAKSYTIRRRFVTTR